MVPDAWMDSPAAPGRMVTVARDWWPATTCTEPLSHVWMITSPAKLLIASRVPFCTATVSSVFGTSSRPAGASACASVSAMSSPVISIVAFCLLPFAFCLLTLSLSLRSYQCRRAAEERELALPRVREMVIEVDVGGIGRQRRPRLIDRLVDRVEVRFENPDRARIEVRASGVERLLEIRDRFVVARIRDRHPHQRGGRGPQRPQRRG